MSVRGLVIQGEVLRRGAGEMKPAGSRALLGDLRRVIAEARQDVARQVNSALVLLYWRVGTGIRQDIRWVSEAL